MASILRQIVAGPRAQHPEANLDLCYVTDNIIATSGPGSTYPQLAYRNPLKDLVKFLDSKHEDKWAIWEFRAEGTGYPDSEVYGRIWHYPWPDHHPPPFALVPLMMASMRNWLKEPGVEGRVVVVHCKAGKGRSGTASCSYLISEEGWSPEDAMARFTERRMRPGFGPGLSIPSQRRYITYVGRWARNGKKYVERPVEILELHVWGLRDGVKIAVEGYVEEGKVIKKFHTFKSHEREVVRGAKSKENGFADVAFEALRRNKSIKQKPTPATGNPEVQEALGEAEKDVEQKRTSSATLTGDVIFRPSSRVVLPSSDVNIDFERRNKTSLGGFTMVTSVAHVWFNMFFEGKGPEQDGIPDDSGVFEMDWDAMDGIKGSSRKGIRAFDKFAVVWKAAKLDTEPEVVINEPTEGQAVQQARPADWQGEEKPTLNLQKKLGLRPVDTESSSISRASSMRSQKTEHANDSAEELKGVRSDVSGDGEEQRVYDPGMASSDSAPAQLDGVSDVTGRTDHVNPSDLPGVESPSELREHKERSIGHMVNVKKSENTT